MTVQRFDVSPLKGPSFTTQGFLKAEAFATRVGIFKYQMMDGTVRKEFRPPEEVFADVSVDSLSELPVTNDHPFEAVTADNAKEYQVGFTGRAEKSEPFVKVNMTLTDKNAIAEVMDKRKDEVSCGYACEVDMMPGEWQGEKYDCVQRSIRYNHLAIVPMGRAGAECRIKVDRADGLGVMVDDEKKTSQKETDAVNSDTEKGDAMKKVKGKKSDGDFVVKCPKCDEEFAVEQEKEKEENDETEKEKEEDSVKLDALKGQLDELSGKLYATTAELEKTKGELEKARADAPTDEQIIARAKARIELEDFAKKVIGDDATFEGKNDAAVKAEVVAKVFPDVDMKEKSEGYVDGAFAIIRQGQSGSDTDVKVVVGKVGTESNKTDSDKARMDAMERARNAWKPAEKTA